MKIGCNTHMGLREEKFVLTKDLLKTEEIQNKTLERHNKELKALGCFDLAFPGQ